MPPPAYWEAVPWWAYLGFLVVIAALASPFAIQVLRGRGESYVSREQAFARRQEAVEKSRTEFLAQLQDSTREAWETTRRERADHSREVDALREDLETGWDLGRGMEDRAHAYRHDLISISMRFNALLDLILDFLAKEVSPEQFAARVKQIKRAENPPNVPKLREVERKKPG